MAEAEVESLWQRQRLAEAEVKKPHSLWRYSFLSLRPQKRSIVSGICHSSFRIHQDQSTDKSVTKSNTRNISGLTQTRVDISTFTLETYEFKFKLTTLT